MYDYDICLASKYYSINEDILKVPYGASEYSILIFSKAKNTSRIFQILADSAVHRMLLDRSVGLWEEPRADEKADDRTDRENGKRHERAPVTRRRRTHAP